MTPRKQSAGILLYRRAHGELEVFLVHPGGPFFAGKDVGAWGVPKGEFEDGASPLDVARREFREETGLAVATCAPGADCVPLGQVLQRGGKIVHAWAVEGDWPAGAVLQSNTFRLEWPPRSGRFRDVPEVDRGEFFPVAPARTKINPAQVAFIDRLGEHLSGGPDPAGDRRTRG